MTTLQTSQKLDEWTIGSQVVSLYQQSDRFVVSKDSEEKSFRSSLYDIGFASNVIHMFHKTVGKNLRCEEKPHSSCFLPKFCMRDAENPDIHIALFGRVVVPEKPNNTEEQKGILQGVRWGVFNIATKEEHTFEDTNDQVVEDFIRGAPASNQPHMITRKNKKGELEETPALDHYAMSSYMKRFRVDLMRDITSRVQGVALHHISLLDPKVVLNEQNWAVTLVVNKESTAPTQWLEDAILTMDVKHAAKRAMGHIVGHAMIASEGVKEGKSFLKYIDLRVTDGKTWWQTVKGLISETFGEAEVREIDRIEPLNTINGPTWIRSKILVENMISFASKIKGQTIKFSLFTDSQKDDQYWTYFYELDNHLEKPILSSYPVTCLDMCYRLLAKAGIWFNKSREIKSPLEKIKQIQTASITTLPDGFDTSYFGDMPLENQDELVNKILSSCVILSPSNCSIEDCNKWLHQIQLEKSAKRE